MMKLKEIAEIEGISHQAVAEIIQKALKKIRLGLEARGYTIEDFK